MFQPCSSEVRWQVIQYLMNPSEEPGFYCSPEWNVIVVSGRNLAANQPRSTADRSQASAGPRHQKPGRHSHALLHASAFNISELIEQILNLVTSR